LDFSGLDSKALFELREKLSKSDCLLRVVKKTLLKKALIELKEEELSRKIEEIKGQLALAFGFEDEVLPAKICYQFSKENENLKILGGFLGKDIMEKDKVIELAKLPSKEELFTRLLWNLESPIFNLLTVLKGNLRNFVYILSQLKVNQ